MFPLKNLAHKELSIVCQRLPKKLWSSSLKHNSKWIPTAFVNAYSYMKVMQKYAFPSSFGQYLIAEVKCETPTIIKCTERHFMMLQRNISAWIIFRIIPYIHIIWCPKGTSVSITYCESENQNSITGVLCFVGILLFFSDTNDTFIIFFNVVLSTLSQ